MSIPTANKRGLDIWGRIVGIGRTVNIPQAEDEYFGFSSGFYPFNQRPFSGAGSASSAWELADSAYRELILLKALSNIIYATAPNINILLREMFKLGTTSRRAYCLISGHMKMRYVFEFNLTPYEKHLVYNTGILPRPCGVLIDLIINLKPETVFGFDGSGLQPFGQGVFYDAT